MFQRVSKADTKLIISALIIMLAIVTLGIGIVEHQLATLTQRPAQERLIYISRNGDQGYWATILGYSTTINSILPDYVSQVEHNVGITIEHYSRKLPNKPEFDKQKIMHWITIWHQQFVGEALLVKKTAGEYWRQFKPYIETTVREIKIGTQQAIHWMEEHIREYR